MILTLELKTEVVSENRRIMKKSELVFFKVLIGVIYVLLAVLAIIAFAL